MSSNDQADSSNKGQSQNKNKTSNKTSNKSSNKSPNKTPNKTLAQAVREISAQRPQRDTPTQKLFNYIFEKCPWLYPILLLFAVLHVADRCGLSKRYDLVTLDHISYQFYSVAIKPFLRKDMDAGLDIVEAPYSYVEVNGKRVKDVASHPMAFSVLREAIIREKGGFVHPDLGFLVPAPSGAPRGLGIVRDSYHECQIRCMPGTSEEKLKDKKEKKKAMREGREDETLMWEEEDESLFESREGVLKVVEAQQKGEQEFRQEEILIKVPYSIQLTRKYALTALNRLIPPNVQKNLPLQELDDAALLVLILAHERGIGHHSMFLQYINTLPLSPSCGYSPMLRPQMLDIISIMGVELGLDVNNWPGELSKAGERARMIAEGLTKDYGSSLKSPKGISAFENIEWALCQVASRGTAGDESRGALRMIPLLDMINHDVNAGGFEELDGIERLRKGDVVDAYEDESGDFIVRSMRHGRRKPLKKGQELLVNYNIPNYSPLDWYTSLGFIPPERQRKWTKIDPALPKVRKYAGSRQSTNPDL